MFESDQAPFDFSNVDDAELCRDETGIWFIDNVRLDEAHEDASVSVPATILGNPNPIDYTTRPMIWSDDPVQGIRTSTEGRLRVNYLIEVE